MNIFKIIGFYLVFIIFIIGCNKPNSIPLPKNEALNNQLIQFIKNNKNANWYAIALNYVDSSFANIQFFTNNQGCPSGLNQDIRFFNLNDKKVYILTGEECIYTDLSFYVNEVYPCLDWDNSVMFLKSSNKSLRQIFTDSYHDPISCNNKCDPIYFIAPNLQN